MSTQPSYSSGSSASGTTPSGPSPQKSLDSIFRRELRVSNPNDPTQIASALLERYKDTPRAKAITQEAQGLPFLQAAPLSTLTTSTTTSSDAEWKQAVDDINMDFQDLSTSAILKDVQVELQGWASAIRTATTEGASAALFALDTRNRDKVFGIRRTLSDYARLARIVGARTPGLTVNYRKLAQSLDEASSVLLVRMGEALANVGFNGGRYLLQVPFSELQGRRDAAINALRNLLGTAQEAYGQEWQRGIGAFRNLMQTLEEQGQGDLRSLLVENELIRLMDNLIHRAGQGGVEGLRHLGVTAQLDLERFRRLIVIAQSRDTSIAPPLAAFLDALLLFTQSFDAAGGFRLLRVARPPILFYGLYGIGGMDNADQRLVQLIVQRGALADRLDCFLERAVGTENEKVQSQIVFDKLLYDVDRAIDLYAVGSRDFADPEIRASAYGDLINVVSQQATLSGRIEVRGGGTGFAIQTAGRQPLTGGASHPDSFFFARIPVEIAGVAAIDAGSMNRIQEDKGEIVARVTDIERVGSLPLAGLMVRDIGRADPNVTPADSLAAFTMIALSPDLGIGTGQRIERNKTSQWSYKSPRDTTDDDTPYWLRLQWTVSQTRNKATAPNSNDDMKVKITIEAYKSADGVQWELLLMSDREFHDATVNNLDPAPSIRFNVGLAVTPSDTNPRALVTAGFDNVRVRGATKTGEYKVDWRPVPVNLPTGESLSGQGIDFTESFLGLTLRSDPTLLTVLKAVNALLDPRLTPTFWDADSRTIAETREAQALRIRELCLQRDFEDRWESLVKTMAPSCADYSGALIKSLLGAAIAQNRSVDSNACPPLSVIIPPTTEDNTKVLADFVEELRNPKQAPPVFNVRRLDDDDND